MPLERPERPAEYDPASAVIKQLEASLAGSPSKDKAVLRSVGVIVDDQYSAGEQSGQGKKGWWKVWGGESS